MNGDIDRIIKFTAKHFVFDEKTYPELVNNSNKQRLIFAIRHSVLHLAKTSGKVASISEAVDHGKEVDMAQLRADISKALIAVLRLAEVIGMSENDIVRTIEEKYNDKI
ncbi:MAG: hypothetical protein COU90_01220 [Candidatus Ryanbacteria bacterium CG10_big_fil_rev_8_21_14_0_10_43_42]|uniref:NTP pyrophosphohydrolase MazG putative catalytic core domain-containing protein n=1 Tax=Candidatus Ryanbacteria bacterium CG10_big_fil_rev_8_21_14_0_10_43_42 TaxID=1974864 RepID=A0A2M8KY61_9BACT|nr:MAG: hypothetical protein COU90_01220 [Candidatus Ryanbacteria bacterium CG10_big_fil_rev_8_21_14_0_10_43_42]